ncbi:MAG: hypothetical protein IPM69_00135 [Ignavibacteria bacterium]|nr:hypothetical protein [Ignavibacteria bacterium]
MQNNHRRFPAFFLLFFLLICNPLFSDIPCDDCDGSGTLEGPFTLMVSVDATLADGCDVTITYYKRTCLGFSNLFITGYVSSGTTCDSITDYAQIERALASMLYGYSISMPPYETTDSTAYWRIMRPACWQKTTVMVDSAEAQSFTSCPDAECCITYFQATPGTCGRRVTYIRTLNTAITCPVIVSPPIECLHSCGRDPLEGWKLQD